MQKVLVIAYYWPPAGGPGVQRWLKFVKHLPEYGITPVVFVPENPHYPIEDAALVAEIPKEIKVVKQPIFEPYGMAALLSKKKTKTISAGMIKKQQQQSFVEKMLLWVRGNLFIPDARKYWVSPSVKAIEKLLVAEGINTIVTTGPPHSVHLIGQRLKRRCDLRWIADFRDPWTSIGYHKKLKLTAVARKKHKRLERLVLNDADHIVVTSNNTKKEFKQITPKPITVITNGFEGEPPKQQPQPAFTLAHIGSLLNERNPTQLWVALAELVKEAPGFKEVLNLQLIGVVGEGVIKAIKQQGLEDYLSLLGYVSHEEVLQYQQQAQLLLLLEIDRVETRGIIPGKLFEYFNAQRPILALGPKAWEAGQMVTEHQAGDYVHQQDKAAIKKVLLARFAQYKNGDLAVAPKNIAQFHRSALTKELSKLLSWASS